MGSALSEAKTEDNSGDTIHVSLDEQTEDLVQQNDGCINSATVTESSEQIQSVNKEECTLLTFLNDSDMMDEQTEISVPAQSVVEFESSAVVQNPIAEDESIIQTEVEPSVVEIMLIQPAKNEITGVTVTVSEEIISEVFPIYDVLTTETKKNDPEVSAVVQDPVAKNTQAKQYTQLYETEMKLVRGRFCLLYTSPSPRDA